MVRLVRMPDLKKNPVPHTLGWMLGALVLALIARIGWELGGKLWSLF